MVHCRYECTEVLHVITYYHYLHHSSLLEANIQNTGADLELFHGFRGNPFVHNTHAACVRSGVSTLEFATNKSTERKQKHG